MSKEHENMSIAGEMNAILTVNKEDKSIIIKFNLPDEIKPGDVHKILSLSLGGSAVNIAKVKIES